MRRSDRWLEPIYLPTVISRPAENAALVDAVRAAPSKTESSLSTWTLVGLSKELVFRVVQSSYEIDYVMFMLDAASGDLVLSRAFSAENLDDDDVKSTMAAAIAQAVPVYPDDDESADDLVRLHASLLAEGFTTTELGGEPKRLKWAGKSAFTFDEQTAQWRVQPTETLSPLDALALAAEATSREQTVAEAVRAITNLRAATSALAELLRRDARDEAALQACLTNYPVLFGLQYRSVVPKYRLGKDFEMDYALEQLGGFVDCVELEASNLRLYTQRGNPTKELVQAEQQVLDWLEWLEANMRLARDDFPGLMRPLGQVVIGRRDTLSPMDVTRLRRRNAAWHGSLAILTYDDLLDRGLHMLGVLTRDASGSSAS